MLGIKKYTWSEIRKQVGAVFPEFQKVIDELSPDETHSLYLSRYGYGQLILEKGIFQVNDKDQKLIPLSQANIADQTKKELTYTGTMPMGMVMKGAIETFFNSERSLFSSASSLFEPKGMIALWCALEGKNTYQAGPIWSVASGAKTICMLPKITDKASYKSLARQFDISLPPPQNLRDHWTLFKKITAHPSFHQKWHSEILFFSEKWFAHQNDPSWARFYQFLMKIVWDHSLFRRNQYIFDYAFSLAQIHKNLKPNPYLADTVKHLVATAMGEAIALRPAQDNSVAPIEGIEQAFLEHYNIKKYQPIVMHAGHFTDKNSAPAYYSLEMPTTTIFSPPSSKSSSRLTDLRDLKHITDSFLNETLKEKLMIEKTPLFQLALNINYNYYHVTVDPYGEITPISQLAEADKNFKVLNANCDLGFPEFAPFFNGCISISKKPT